MIAGSHGSVQWLSDLLEPASVYHVPPKQIVSQLDGSSNTMNKKVIIINEGAGDAVALLGTCPVYFFAANAALSDTVVFINLWS